MLSNALQGLRHVMDGSISRRDMVKYSEKSFSSILKSGTVVSTT